MTYRDRYETVLRAMPGTVDEIAERLRVPKSTVKKWVATLRRFGWAHVGRWQRSAGSGAFQPIIAGGPGRDAQCRLKALKPAQYVRNCRARSPEHARALRIIHRGVAATPFDALLRRKP